MDERFDLARDFAASAGWGDAVLDPIAGDASARRYYRLARGQETAVLMDAPASDGQDVGPFVSVAGVLRAKGLSAPRILSTDKERGFLLLEDLGDALFADVITNDAAAEEALYQSATDVLIALDQSDVPGFVPGIDPARMAQQVAPFFDWYLGDVPEPQKKAIQGELETVLAENWGGRNTLLLRDFHAENLIWLPERIGDARVGLLDFQDAMAGPPGYDLVSLLLDARRDVSPSVISTMIRRFADNTGHSVGSFAKSFAAIGVQRNLRILGVFARLAKLHGKPRYLAFQPRVRRHVMACLAHSALDDLSDALRAAWPEMSPG